MVRRFSPCACVRVCVTRRAWPWDDSREMWGRRSIKRISQQVLILFAFSTTCLILYSLQRQPSVTSRTQLKEKLRIQRLREVRETLFINPIRPPDESYNINVSLSEQIPLEREVIDSRTPECLKHVYVISSLPTVSVIIPFYNEALSMLLRTVHSILKTTPPELLKEIIMVNDHSLNEDLNEPLIRYVKYLPDKVKLVRTQRREGLIRARMIGAGMAEGEVLMFQDGHTENNAQWAEPLLTELKRDPTLIIQPEVDQVDAMTIEYQGANGQVPRGGFSWDLRYTWMEMPEHEKKRVFYEQNYRPFRTPVLVGCALAVNKQHFFDIGGFDDAMEIWGGENIELAFRNWMCAGGVYSHPCSRVAHTFKPFSYKFDGDRDKIVQKNLLRIAELWMGDWGKYFLASTYSWPSKRTFLTDKDRATLQVRKDLRQELMCKPFDWYMKNIVPEIPTPPVDAHFYGEPANIKSEACFYLTKDGFVGLTYSCFYHRVLPQNLFFIDKYGIMKYHSQQGDAFNQCIHMDPVTFLLIAGQCVTNEYWTTDLYSENEGQIKVTLTDTNETYCLTHITNVNARHHGEQMPQAIRCKADDDFQKWRWPYVFDWQYSWEEAPQN